MNTIFKFLKTLINIYTIAIVVAYYFFGTITAAITLVSLISLKLISQTVKVEFDILKWFSKIPLIGSKIGYLQNLAEPTSNPFFLIFPASFLIPSSVMSIEMCGS